MQRGGARGASDGAAASGPTDELVRAMRDELGALRAENDKLLEKLTSLLQEQAMSMDTELQQHEQRVREAVEADAAAAAAGAAIASTEDQSK